MGSPAGHGIDGRTQMGMPGRTRFIQRMSRYIMRLAVPRTIFVLLTHLTYRFDMFIPQKKGFVKLFLTVIKKVNLGGMKNFLVVFLNTSNLALIVKGKQNLPLTE